jgi:chromosome segregation ATPase
LARVAALDTRANQAARTLSDVETAASAVGAMTGKIKELTDTVREARQTADRLTAPDGDLHQQRHLMQQLASQSLQTRNTIDTLASEQQRLEALGADLKRATEQLQQSRLLVTDTTAEIAAVRTAAEDARAAQATMRDLATRTQDDAERAVATVREIDQKLQGLTALQALARSVEQKTVSLNSLAEHVLQKTKVLEYQKDAVEAAVLESHRVTELVREMEG